MHKGVNMNLRNHYYNFSINPNITGKRIKELRKARKLTAKKLAEQMKCSVKTVSSWETGTRFPSIDVLVDLANFFDVSLQSLMLPLDNCPYVEWPFYPDKFNGSTNKHILYNLTDSEIAKALTRREYLTQRIMQNAFTSKNKDELNLIRKLFTMDVYKLDSFTDFYNSSISSASLDDHWKYIQCELHLREEYLIQIFKRLMQTSNLPLTLNSLDLIDKSILFTCFAYFPELRECESLLKLCEQGAGFICCNFYNEHARIKAKLDYENAHSHDGEKLINSIKISNEEDLDQYLHIYSDKTEAYKVLGIPKYDEDPTFYSFGHKIEEWYVDEIDDVIIDIDWHRFIKYETMIHFICLAIGHSSLSAIEEAMIFNKHNTLDEFINYLKGEKLLYE